MEFSPSDDTYKFSSSIKRIIHLIHNIYGDHFL